MNRKLELGLCIFEPRGGDGGISPWGMLEEAEIAEAMGMEYVALPDRVSRPTPRYDTLTLMAAMALRTKRVRMKTHIFVLPLRHPIELARRLVTVDHLSKGRFIFAVGLGGEGSPVYTKEYQDVGIPKNERGRRADEILEALKLLLSQPKSTFEGKYYSFKDVVFEPKPYQQPHIPIWVGGVSDAALRRVAKFGDGWAGSIENLTNAFGSIKGAVDKLRNRVTEAGRDPKSVHISICVRANINPNREKADSEAEAFWTQQMGSIEGGRPFDKKLEIGLYGPAGMMIDKLQELHANGVHSVIIHVHSFNMKEQLKQFEREVLPAFK